MKGEERMGLMGFEEEIYSFLLWFGLLLGLKRDKIMLLAVLVI